MFNYYFQQELSHLKIIGGEFAKENPAIAPMLGDPSTDPDVDRLLEGVAFLTGSIQQKIDDEFPEIIHNYIRQVWPHFLRPVPATTLMEVFPEEGEDSGASVPVGAEVDSLEVEGTACRFRTCSHVHMDPVSVVRAGYEESPDGISSIRVTLACTSPENWASDTLKFYLGGGYAEASELYLQMLNGVSRIVVAPGGGRPEAVLPPHCLKPCGFSAEEALIPWPTHCFDGYRFLQEYFVLPEKFLFIELSGLQTWRGREGVVAFDLLFELKSTPDVPLRIDASNFKLFVTPAVNVFSHSADPVRVSQKKNEYRVRPTASDPSHYQIYAIEQVSGYKVGSGEGYPMKHFHSLVIDETDVVYSEILKRSPVRDAMDFSISLATPGGKGFPDVRSLSFDVLCTNGDLPERLLTGEIRVSTVNTPEGLGMRNIRKPTQAVLPPLGTNALWSLVSILNLNHFCLTRCENLKAMLKLFLMDGRTGRRLFAAGEKRVEGIVSLDYKYVNRLFKGAMMRGLVIQISMRRDHFAGMGDLYLFSSVIDTFIGLSADLNTFTQLEVTEVATGERFVWKERMGNQLLG